MRSLARLCVLPLIILLSPGVAAWAQDKDEEATPEQEFFYQWTDDEGVIHFVDSLSKVPAAHRSSPDLLEIPLGTAEPDAPSSRDTPTGSSWDTGGASAAPPPGDEDPTAAPQSPEERLLELRKKRDDLLIRINQLEEGFAAPEHADRDDEELERLLDQSEKLLERVDREIRKLEAAHDR